MQKGKVAVMTGVNKPLDIREYLLTKPALGMAQLRLIASGVCGTDVHFMRGKIPANFPMAIGHEFVGQVMELSPEDSEKYGIRPGDNAVVDIACPCGKCALCEAGDDANCLNMGVTNGGSPDVAPHFVGGYGQFNYSPVANLIKIPEDLDPVMVSAYACAGPTALHAFRLAEQANCRLKDAKVAVVQGLGPVGTFAVLYLASLGIPHIIAINGVRQPRRADVAMSLGATEVHDLESETEEQILNRILELSPAGADVVFEASGNPKAVPQGMNMLRNRGVYLVPGQYSNSGPIPILPQQITFKALHIIGSSQYSVVDVENYLAFLQQNPGIHDTILKLITAYHIHDANRAMEDAAAGRNIKTVLIP